MNIDQIPAGQDVPNDINVIIEIPANGQPVKYEIDKDSGALMVDRFMTVAMFYPCNYGFIPHTLAEDGDPVDVLVITPVPLVPGSVVRSRPIGVLQMTDESGPDAKILAVPVSKLYADYDSIRGPEDASPALLASIKHFFERYKVLDKGKWVKVEDWAGVDAACDEIIASQKRFQKSRI